MNVKTREFYVKVALISIIIITIASIFIERHVESINAEQEERRMHLLNKAWFGSDMGFEFRYVASEANLSPGARWVFVENGFHTNLIFVRSEAKSIGFPDDVIVGWPRTIEDTGETDTDFYETLISGIHWAVNRTELGLTQRGGVFDGRLIRPIVTLEEFGLTHPLTIEDLVDNWEKVSELWWTFADNERSRILEGARSGRRTW